MLKHIHSRLRGGLKFHGEWQQVPNYVGNTRKAHLRLNRGLQTGRPLSRPVKPFVLSDIGEGIKQVVIKQWHVKEGDTVQEFDDICDVESDKAFTTITSKYKGTIKKIHHDRDAIALVGHPLVDIETLDPLSTTKEESLAESPLVRDSLQSKTKSIEGEMQKSARTPEIQTSQESRAEILNDQSREAKGSQASRELNPGERVDDRALATPAVRRLVRENQLNLNEIRGTGRDGRRLKEDVLDFIANNKNNQRHDEAKNYYDQLKSTQPPPLSQDLVYRVEGLQKHMVRSMNISNSIPTLVYSDEVDVTNLARWRSEFKETLQKRNIKLSFLPFMIKAMSLSIIKYPIANAKLDEKCEKIIFKSAHNIGFAVASPKGLIVPNIKNVRSLSILQVALELERLQSLAQAGTLSPSDVSGGTITISNIGSIGGIHYKPLINPPEVVIAATGRMQMLPRYDSAGELKKTNIINVSWAADHRIIDGATIANFSNTWKEYIENPTSLLLGLV